MAFEQTNSKYTNANRNELLTGVYGIGDPKWERAVFKRFGLQFAQFTNWFKMLGREEPIALGKVSTTTEPDYTAWEENKYLRTIKVGATVTGGGSAGALATFTLHADNFDSLNNYPLQVGDILLAANEVPVMVTTISGSGNSQTVTIKPVDASDTIVAPTPNTTEYIKLSNAYAAGTGQPDPSSIGFTKTEFWAQIFKKTVSWEGSEMVRDLVMDTFDSKGNKMGITTYDIARAEIELNREIANAFLLGKVTTNTALTQTTAKGVANLIKTTEGIIPKIKRLGTTTNIATGTFEVSDLDAATAYGISQGVNSNMFLWAVGRTLRKDIREALKEYNDGGGTDYRQLATVFNFEENNTGMKDYIIDMGFKAINLDGVIHVFNTIEDWSNPDGLGHSSYGFDKNGIILPISTMKQPGGGLEKNFCVKYIQKNGYSRKMEVWHNGAAGGNSLTYVGDIDEDNVYMRAHQMLVALGVNQMQYIYA